MAKGEFYTRRKDHGKNLAVKVHGNIDRKRGIGFYRWDGNGTIWADEWHAVDLKSGMSIASASNFAIVRRQLTENWDKVVKVRADRFYPQLCSAFAENIAEAEEERMEP